MMQEMYDEVMHHVVRDKRGMMMYRDTYDDVDQMMTRLVRAPMMTRLVRAPAFYETCKSSCIL